MNQGYLGKAEFKVLPTITDRLTFLYIERCKVFRQDGAILVIEERGRVYIPAATIAVLLCGPGTDVTHRAMELLADVGCAIIWVGEHGVRYYAHGQPITHSNRLLLKQAQAVTNSKIRIAIARKMYQMRFPNEDVSRLSMQSLRGREGARVRGVYREYSKQYHVPWQRRSYKPGDFEFSDDVNKAISSGNQCLYGLAHTVTVALGMSPGLGIVHDGHDRSFVYDLADLYKADTVIPLSFKLAGEETPEIENAIRRELRDVFREKKLIKQMVKDIYYLFDEETMDHVEPEYLELWDKAGNVNSGVGYRLEDEE